MTINAATQADIPQNLWFGDMVKSLWIESFLRLSLPLVF